MSTQATHKTLRINLRTTARQDELLRRAAHAGDKTVTDFVLGSAVAEAERVLADRRWFLASDEAFDQFQRLLDEPTDATRLARLLAADTPFDQVVEIADA